MFSKEIHLILYRRLGGILRLGKASIDEKLKHAVKMDGRVSYVFYHNKKYKDFDKCIKQEYAYTRLHTVTICTISAAKRCIMESLKLSPPSGNENQRFVGLSNRGFISLADGYFLYHQHLHVLEKGFVVVRGKADL